MIEYRFPEEKDMLMTYAARLGDARVEAILARGTVDTEADARALAQFFWRMVDASLTDDDSEVWHERIHTTLFAALGQSGFGDVWDEEIPDA
jgi:hypothetical protein